MTSEIDHTKCIELQPGSDNTFHNKNDIIYACDVTMSVYPHGGNRTHDLWNTSPMLCPLSYTRSGRFEYAIYHILEPSWPRSSVGRALGWYSKGRGFDSHRGQAYFPSLPGVDIHSEQGRRNDVKARGADFRERALLNWYILRDVCKTSGVELRLIMFSIYWMIGVWGVLRQAIVLFLKLDDCISCVFWSKFVKESH